MRRGRRRRYPALIAASGLLAAAAGCTSHQAAEPAATATTATVAASAAVTASAATPAPGRDPLAGVRWRLTLVRGPAGSVAVPASLDAWFSATSRYAVQGSDGCASFDGTGHRSPAAFTVSGVMIAGNGCADDSRALTAAVDGFGQVLNGQRAQVLLSGTQLRLTAGSYTLVFTSA